MPSRRPAARRRGHPDATGRHRTAYALGRDASGDEDALVDEAFLDLAAVGVEAAVREVLAELELDTGPPVAVLLHGEDAPPAEALDVAEVVDEVVTGHDVDLLAEDEDDVRVVGDRGRAPQVLGP